MIKDNIKDIIQDIQEGKMVIILDDESRENEGDLVCAADKVTPEIINFMASKGKGLICLPLSKDLINKFDLKDKIGLEESEYQLAGVLILFNNLLQSLFRSQILTLGLVIIGIFIMFLILFRNIKLSLIGVVPNFIAAFFILGIIGLLEIPLDMMTITIAAITIGIAVDNSIHYIYRFKEEFNKIKDYNKTLQFCHSTVGVAILNTSITIVFGFSILVLSKFIPTIYFGMFTGLAMLLAMISVLTLLPALILIIKPFGKSA